MNKTEAIKVLKKDLQIIDDPNVTMTAREWEEHDDHMRDALEMAIEALEKEETLQNLTKPNKSDLISRQAAIDALYDKGLSMTAWGELLAMKWSDIQTCIELLPSADRPRGQWIEDEKQNVLMRKFIEKGEMWRVCSVCGAGLMIGAEYETDKYYHETFHNYCPNCGADMTGGEKE